MFTQSGGNGGSITLDPSSVTLVNSMISANGGVNGGNVSIRPDVFFSNTSTVTATGATGVSGRVLLTQPDPSIGASLVQLPGTLADFDSQLAPKCAARSDGDFSSFIVIGAGGQPPEPGGLIGSELAR